MTVSMEFLGAVDQGASNAGLSPMGTKLANETPVYRARRAGRRLKDDDTLLLTLSERDGMLLWSGGPPPLTGEPARRRGGGGVTRILRQYKTQKIEPNKITSYLQSLDSRLTPYNGLRQWNGNAFVDGPTVPKEGRILLFIHGTFSKCDMFVDQLHATVEGRELLSSARSRYSAVLGFDHPTLSIAPVLNALDLASVLKTDAEVDVICHSRGGLVARWWADVFIGNAKLMNIINVGAPLEGTSLAAAPNLRAAINYLTNIANVLAHVAHLSSAIVPLMSIVGGLVNVLASLGGLAVHTPAIDAAIALIPGIHAQARVSNNLEITRLHHQAAHPSARFYAVGSDFKPTSPEWQFWRYFMKPVVHTSSALASVIFDDANDLVVDTSSMKYGKNNNPADSAVHTFQGDTVHHLNYFVQPETCAFIKRTLAI